MKKSENRKTKNFCVLIIPKTNDTVNTQKRKNEKKKEKDFVRKTELKIHVP